MRYSFGDARRFEARHHNDGLGAALDGLAGDTGDNRFAADALEQFVAEREARRATGGQDNGRDLRAHQRDPLPRCTAVISPTMDSAISAAPCAPISSPIGA